jgi:hypothetical protein
MAWALTSIAIFNVFVLRTQAPAPAPNQLIVLSIQRRRGEGGTIGGGLHPLKSRGQITRPHIGRRRWYFMIHRARHRLFGLQNGRCSVRRADCKQGVPGNEIDCFDTGTAFF